MKSIGKKLLGGGLAILALAGLGLLSGCDQDAPISRDDALIELEKLKRDVIWRDEPVGQVQTVAVPKTTLADSLPPIGKFGLVVNPPTGNTAAVEIFVSTEKSGTGRDGWMREVAEAFNGANVTLANGRKARVKIRKIPSGTGFQFIASRKYTPDAFSPSNLYWVRMVEGSGVPVTKIRERTVGNVAGIVMKEETAEKLSAGADTFTIPAFVDAVVRGDVVAGYTNPFASSTGLNFLVTVLETFGKGNERAMLSPEVVSAFTQFQRNVPFVAMTTLQMRDSVARDGSLESFVMEYQTFVNTPELQSDYIFKPFGLPHDNPLYGIGSLSAEKKEVLEKFAEFMERDQFISQAKKYGFNQEIDHSAPFDIPSGPVLIDAQKVWKEQKSAGRPVSVVFLADTSGSMQGERLNQLKQALLEGSNFISPEHSIGLVTFSGDVKVVVPIKPFNLLQKSTFLTGVNRMTADGNTAMYDGIVVALSMLMEEVRKNPDVKPVLIALTDGNTTSGMEFYDVDKVLAGLQVPIYTIGFEADVDELKRVSGLVEASSTNADNDNVRFVISSLLNAQM